MCIRDSYYSDFAEKGYYNRIIAGNINQVLKVDLSLIHIYIISSPVVKESIINNSDCKILLDQRKYMNKFEMCIRDRSRCAGGGGRCPRA